MRTLFLFVASIIFCLNFSHAKTLKGSATENIHSNIRQFSEYGMRQQPEKIALAYTEDAKLFPMNSDILIGRKAIQAYGTTTGTNRTRYHKITPLEIEVIGDTAYDHGYYESKNLREDGTEVHWKGKYVIVKKIDDQWLIYLDCWNPIRQ